MKDYLRCIVANRFCFLGFITTLCGFPVWLHGFSKKTTDLEMFLGFVVMQIGVMALSATGFGLETLIAYRRTKEHIQKFGRVGDNFYYITYCGNAGYRLAIKESTTRGEVNAS